MLHLLAQTPGSGYDVIKQVEAATGGQYTPSAGVVYPTLTLMQDIGHLAAEEVDRGRNIFTVTPAGRAYLDAYQPMTARLFKKMQDARFEQQLAIPEDIRTALSAVEVAVRSRLRRSGGGGSDIVRRLDELVAQLNSEGLGGVDKLVRWGGRL